METKPLRRILIVDDEANIVNAVRRELMTPPLGRYRYEVEGFTEPQQALECAGNWNCDAVIADYRMPGMDGLEFLKALSAIRPDCARLVLSGQTDIEALIRMVNETHIYRFIPKPWHDYYLKGSLAQALDYSGTLAESRRMAAFVSEHGISVPAPEAGEVETILIVDDDPNVLNSLTRVLTRHTPTDDLFSAIRAEVAHAAVPVLEEGRISVQITPSARHALKLARDTEFACVIADRRMPEMNGIELLQQFAELRPDCERILISGGIEESELIDAIAAAGIFAFVGKPWTDFELKSTVGQALAHRRMTRENHLLAELVRKAGGR